MVLEHDGQTFVHEKFMHIADHEIVYRQLHRVDNDEQLVSIDFEYDYTGIYQFIITVVILFFDNIISSKLIWF